MSPDSGGGGLSFLTPYSAHDLVIRPIMLYGERVIERSRQTEIDRSVVWEKARRFVRKGMFGLQDLRPEPSADLSYGNERGCFNEAVQSTMD